MGLAGCGSALDPPVVCSAGRSGAVVPVLVLLFVALWFILRGDLLCVFPCVVLFLCFFSPFSIAIASLGEGGGGGAGGWSWCFSCICSACACLDFSVSSSSLGLGGVGAGGGGLRFVVVALPGLFSCLFFQCV